MYIYIICIYIIVTDLLMFPKFVWAHIFIDNHLSQKSLACWSHILGPESAEDGNGLRDTRHDHLKRKDWIHDDTRWYIMIHYDTLWLHYALWYIMILYDTLWLHYDTLLWYIISRWYTMIHYDTLCFIVICYDMEVSTNGGIQNGWFIRKSQ